MEAAASSNNFEKILTLFDLYWFHLLILLPPRPQPPVPEPASSEPHGQPQALPPQPIRHRRTRSNESLPNIAPHPAPERPRLQTILSGKESLNRQQPGDPTQASIDAVTRRRQLKHRLSRSMSELELEELKGLIDLGFNFSDTEVERDPRIVDIVPALKRKRRSEEDVVVEVMRRPYLSEAWSVGNEEEKKVLSDWRVLQNGDENQVKEQLRRWAHAVASAVN